MFGSMEENTSASSNAGKRKRVVIVMDGSEHSMYAFKWYVDKLRVPGDIVTIIHCAQYENMTYGSVSLFPGDPTIVERIINDEEKRISTLIDSLQTLLQQHEIEGEAVRIQGEPGHALLNKATEVNADMIVVGSRGLGTVRRTVLGSISDYLIHHSHVPVVVCKHDAPKHHHQHHKHQKDDTHQERHDKVV